MTSKGPSDAGLWLWHRKGCQALFSHMVALGSLSCPLPLRFAPGLCWGLAAPPEGKEKWLRSLPLRTLTLTVGSNFSSIVLSS